SPVQEVRRGVDAPYLLPPRGVDVPNDPRAVRGRASLELVYHHGADLLDVQDLLPSQRAMVRLLAASPGIECSLVQRHVAAWKRPQYLRFEVELLPVLVV